MKKLDLIFTLLILLVAGCTKQEEEISLSLPNAPSNLNVLVSANRNTLDWTDNSTNEEGFKIERKSSGGVFTVINTVEKDITNFLDNSVNPATTYTYRVYSYNAKGNSLGYSNEVTITAISLPVLSTTSITGVANSSATSGGTVISDAGSVILSKGVVWDIATNPTVNLTTKTVNGAGSGSFTSNIAVLTENTTYYVRAYATNAAGTSYGNELIFKTQGRPTLSTLSVTNISTFSASSGGIITDDNGDAVSARGVVWATSPSPTVNSSGKSSNGTGLGTFTSNITGLFGSTTYYIRSYGTNKYGTGYGNETSFKTDASKQGVTVAGGNGPGNSLNQFDYPSDVFVDANNNVFVLDRTNKRVQRWSSGAVSGVTVASCVNNPSNCFDGTNLYVSTNGEIYISDGTQNSVRKWLPNNVEFGKVVGGNGAGSGANQLNNPRGIYIDASGNLYVADRFNHRVQKFTPGSQIGVTVAGGKGKGSDGTQLSEPHGVFVDSSGNIYVADTGNHRIQKWTPGATSGITVAGGNNSGYDPNQLSWPLEVFVDSSGSIYVLDGTFNDRVQKWLSGATSGVTVAGGNGNGCEANQLGIAVGFFVDKTGNIYIADGFCNRVQKWTP